MSFVKDTYLTKEKFYLQTNWHKYSNESFYQTYSMNPLMATSIDMAEFDSIFFNFGRHPDYMADVRDVMGALNDLSLNCAPYAVVHRIHIWELF